MSLISRLRTASALSWDERYLALRAIALLALSRAALLLLGYARTRRVVDRSPVGVRRGPEFAAAVRRAMQRAARSLPGSTCLPQALVAARLLRTAGLPAELTIGVAYGASPAIGLHAHAWVRSGDLVVVGDADLARYTELSGAQAPT